MNKKNRITIIRSAIGSLPAAGLLKFLHENGFRVIGTDITDNVVGKFYVDRLYTVPMARNAGDVIAAYKEIIKKENAQWIISGPEEEILVLSGQKAAGHSLKARLFHPGLKTLDVIVDKSRMCGFFKSKQGVQIPETYNLGGADGWKPGQKVVLKPKMGRGSNKVFVTERKNLTAFCSFLKKNEYIVQKHIVGSEFTVDTLSDLEGNTLNIIPRLRVKTDSGVSVITETVKDDKIIQIVAGIMRELKFIGANCFQFIRDAGGVYYLIDINPRFGGGAILSLKASKTFRLNVVNLLNGRHDKLCNDSFDYKLMRMFRFHQEIYEI